MPRPPLPVGSWGKISRVELEPKLWRARARFRDFTGATALVEARGVSGAAAQRRLEAVLRARVEHAGADITPEMTLKDLGMLWLGECELSALSAQSLDRYRSTFTRIVCPGVGQLRIREASVSAMDRFLKQAAVKAPSSASRAKVVLSGMLSMATRHDAIRANPIREVAAQRMTKKPVRALSVADVAELRRGVALWLADPTQKGQRRSAELADMVDIFLATGARIGELCALRWQDVDLAATRATLTISGTTIRVAGAGITRQDHPKTSAGHRTVTLPAFAVQTLLRRQVNATPNALNLVFPTSSGTLRESSNFRRQWRDARAFAGFDWVVPHTFRKTVATLIDQERSTADAAAQLGHSAAAMTATHYVARAAIAPDVSDVLQAFAGIENDE